MLPKLLKVLNEVLVINASKKSHPLKNTNKLTKTRHLFVILRNVVNNILLNHTNRHISRNTSVVMRAVAIERQELLNSVTTERRFPLKEELLINSALNEPKILIKSEIIIMKIEQVL